jgi:hypothetical protein
MSVVMTRNAKYNIVYAISAVSWAVVFWNFTGFSLRDEGNMAVMLGFLAVGAVSGLWVWILNMRK